MRYLAAVLIGGGRYFGDGRLGLAGFPWRGFGTAVATNSRVVRTLEPGRPTAGCAGLQGLLGAISVLLNIPTGAGHASVALEDLELRA